MREDWIETGLGELSLLELGGDWGKDPNLDDDDYTEAYCIRGSEFRNWATDKGKTASLRKIKKDSIEKRNLLLNDILVEISGGGPEQPVGRTVVIEHSVLNHFKEKNLVCTNFLRLIRPSDFVDSIYLNHYLKYFYSTGKIIRYQSGSNNLRNLKFNDYLTIGIPLAPLPIQRAIVSKIEALFSDLDNGIANFKKAQAQLKIYRQAVLKKAFEGELTKEWRKDAMNRASTALPTVEELLQQIKEERQNHYNQQMEDWKKAVKDWEKGGKVGSKPSKPQSIKEVPALKDEELENLCNLPKGWFWNKFGNVCLKIMDGTHFSPKNMEKGEYKYITAKNIKEGRIDLSNITYVSNDDHKLIYARCDVKKGDVLYIKDGATTGKAAINNLNEEFSLLSSVGVFRVSENVILPKYLEYFLNAEVNKNRMLENVAGVAITRLTLVKLNHSYFSVCSLQEQHQIVAEIERRLSVCDKMEQSITESLAKAEALRQSILKKAFEGKLLSQAEIAQCKKEADYEPASELLKKIKSEQLAKEQGKRKKA